MMEKQERTAEQRDRDREVRARFQKAKPSMEELLASGEYETSVKQGEYLDFMQFVAKFKALRESLHLSLTEIAERTGIDKAQLSQIENGVAENPTIWTLERLARSVGKRLTLRLKDMAIESK